MGIYRRSIKHGILISRNVSINQRSNNIGTVLCNKCTSVNRYLTVSPHTDNTGSEIHPVIFVLHCGVSIQRPGIIASYKRTAIDHHFGMIFVQYRNVADRIYIRSMRIRIKKSVVPSKLFLCTAAIIPAVDNQLSARSSTLIIIIRPTDGFAAHLVIYSRNENGTPYTWSLKPFCDSGVICVIQNLSLLLRCRACFRSILFPFVFYGERYTVLNSEQSTGKTTVPASLHNVNGEPVQVQRVIAINVNSGFDLFVKLIVHVRVVSPMLRTRI